MLHNFASGSEGLRVLVVTFDSMLTFETHLREVVSKAAGSLGVVRALSRKIIFIVHMCARAVLMHMFV